MNPQEYFEKQREQLAIQSAQLDNQAAQMQLAQQQLPHEQDVNMIKEQLSLGDELKTIDYLLRSWTLEVDEATGQSKWKKPDDSMVILSHYGIHFFREAIAWYMNKNTLLSAYESEEVLDKMKDFATTINDAIFNEYEKIFRTPTIEECKKEFDSRIDEKVEIKKYALEMLGEKAEEVEITKQIISEMETTLEDELMEIRSQLMKQKLKRFTPILRFVQDAVHSSYNRAIGGQERRSLRQTMSITETKGGFAAPVPDQRGGFLGWGQKK